MNNLSDRYLFRGKQLGDGKWVKGSLAIAHLLLRFNSYTLTKLGNVYDNPELMGGDTHE